MAPTAYFAKATKARERGPTEGSEYRAGRFDLETVALQRQPYQGGELGRVRFVSGPGCNPKGSISRRLPCKGNPT